MEQIDTNLIAGFGNSVPKLSDLTNSFFAANKFQNDKRLAQEDNARRNKQEQRLEDADAASLAAAKIERDQKAHTFITGVLGQYGRAASQLPEEERANYFENTVKPHLKHISENLHPEDLGEYKKGIFESWVNMALSPGEAQTAKTASDKLHKEDQAKSERNTAMNILAVPEPERQQALYDTWLSTLPEEEGKTRSKQFTPEVGRAMSYAGMEAKDIATAEATRQNRNAITAASETLSKTYAPKFLEAGADAAKVGAVKVQAVAQLMKENPGLDLKDANTLVDNAAPTNPLVAGYQPGTVYATTKRMDDLMGLSKELGKTYLITKKNATDIHADYDEYLKDPKSASARVPIMGIVEKYLSNSLGGTKPTNVQMTYLMGQFPGIQNYLSNVEDRLILGNQLPKHIVDQMVATTDAQIRKEAKNVYTNNQTLRKMNDASPHSVDVDAILTIPDEVLAADSLMFSHGDLSRKKKRPAPHPAQALKVGETRVNNAGHTMKKTATGWLDMGVIK